MAGGKTARRSTSDIAYGRSLWHHHRVGKILSALLILMLVCSHGSMGAGAPHVDGSVHSHSVASVGVDDHHDFGASDHAADQTVKVALDDDSGKVPAGMGHHTHVVGDSVPTTNFALLAPVYENGRFAFGDAARLPSMTLAPLPEPPSA